MNLQMTKSKDDLYSELVSWVNSRQWACFGTLKFIDGSNISNERGADIISRYFNKLDRIYYGLRGIKEGNRIERVVVRHFGASRTNLHYHFVACPQSDIDLFCENAKCIWDSIDHSTAGYNDIQISAVRSSVRAGQYLCHEHWLQSIDTLSLETTHLGASKPRSNDIARLRRLLKQKDKNETIIERARMCQALFRTR